MRYFIGDTETTGVGPFAKVCDIAFMEIDPHTLNLKWVVSSLVDPGVPIPPNVSAIHGIYDEHVMDAPTIDEFVAHRMGGRIDEPCVLIAHNVKFDQPFFAPVMDVSKTLCTLMMTREIYPHSPPDGPENHKLTTVASFLGLPVGEAHRALGDSLTVLHLLRHLLGHTGKSIIELLDIPVKEVYYMPFGAHAGKPLIDLPQAYRTWLLTIDIDANLRYSLMRLREAGI